MRYAAIALFAISLSACSILQNEVERGYERAGAVLTPATITTADVRMVTERRHPVLGIPVICTEPSPDVAKALSAAVALSGQSGGTAPVGVAASGATAEAVAELAGRSTALLGLRDGLFRACEAYANGAIGADAYALVLSRYGQLMTTLFLGQDVTGATFKGAVAQSPAVTVNANAPGATVTTPKPVTAAPAPTSVAAAGGDAPALSGDSEPPKPKPSAEGSSAAPAAPLQSETTLKVPDSGPMALARMNEDYMNLDYNFAHLLAVACLNANDPTRPHPRTISGIEVHNEWLQSVCSTLPRNLHSVVTDAIALSKAGVIGKPVAPAASAK